MVDGGTGLVHQLSEDEISLLKALQPQGSSEGRGGSYPIRQYDILVYINRQSGTGSPALVDEIAPLLHWAESHLGGARGRKAKRGSKIP